MGYRQLGKPHCQHPGGDVYLSKPLSGWAAPAAFAVQPIIRLGRPIRSLATISPSLRNSLSNGYPDVICPIYGPMFKFQRPPDRSARVQKLHFLAIGSKINIEPLVGHLTLGVSMAIGMLFGL